LRKNRRSEKPGSRLREQLIVLLARSFLFHFLLLFVSIAFVLFRLQKRCNMNPLAKLLALPEQERQTRGLAHTPNEIAQQAGTWLSTYEVFCERKAEILRFVQSAGIGSEQARRPTVFLVGAGTSDYIGRSLTQLLRRRWQCEVLAVPSTDLLTHASHWLVEDLPYLWVSFSRSGESPEGVAVIERALKSPRRVRHLIVNCNQDSAMMRVIAGRKEALGIVLPDATHDRGLAMTSSFSNMVVFGHCLAHVEDPASYLPLLQRLERSAKGFLDDAAAKAAELANGNFSSVCFLGSGPLKAVATESALKVLELTAGKVRAESESALGLRHGPMAALDRQTLVIAFLSGEEKVREYELDLLEEIGSKKLVGERAVVAAGSIAAECADHVLNSDIGVADDYRPPLDVIFGQLLGLFFSLRHGLKPDCPSPNGAISRVVQNVKIHC
jgi:tagatose-6-phosphate ketose/aldose isomerase